MYHLCLYTPTALPRKLDILNWIRAKGASVSQRIEKFLRRVIRVCATKVPRLRLTLSALHPDA